MEDVVQNESSMKNIDPGNGDIATATIPKKRGRPPTGEKKLSTGRGRGRPSKNSTTSAAVVSAKRNSDASEDETNGDISETVAAPVVVPGRGRPPKQGKPKNVEPIMATGKGRGRPKNPPKSEDDSDDDNEDAVVEVKKRKPKKPAKKVGRPKKQQQSGDDSGSIDNDDDDDEPRPVGRPSTGAINLNIERTGRGQGRPKKGVIANTVTKRSAVEANGDGNAVPKKRGRPSLSKIPQVSSGKPRGRPKANANVVDNQKDSQDEESNDDADLSNSIDKTIDSGDEKEPISCDD